MVTVIVEFLNVEYDRAWHKDDEQCHLMRLRNEHMTRESNCCRNVSSICGVNL